jgi:predicted metal-dependent hydrolase
MTEVARRLDIGSEVIAYALKRTARKTLGISVAPDGSVNVTAPLDANETEIELRIRKRAAWILDKIDEAVLRTPALPDRCFLPGETHLYLGRQYRLRVDPTSIGTRREDDRIVVGGVSAKEPTRIRNRLFRWYETEGNRVFTERLTECLRPFGPALKRPKLKIAAMERRWGSYVAESHSLILNHALMQVPLPLIDYVITHELCHIGLPNHGSEFERLLTKIMPDHAHRKQKLELVFT